MAEIWGDSVDKKLHEGGWLIFVKFKDRSEPINILTRWETLQRTTFKVKSYSLPLSLLKLAVYSVTVDTD